MKPRHYIAGGKDKSAGRSRHPDPSLDERARSLIPAMGGERRAIPRLLKNAWLTVQPSCPELDEPVAAQKARSERARAIAVRALWLIYRAQLARGEVDEPIRRFFAEQAELRIWNTANPEAAGEALAKFLGERPGRGRRREKAWRDFSLAADIQELVNNGLTVDEACETMSERLEATGQKLDSDTLHNIFFRETRSRLDKRAIEAELFTRAMRELRELQNRASPSAAETERVLQLQEKIFAWQEKFNARRL